MANYDNNESSNWIGDSSGESWVSHYSDRIRELPDRIDISRLLRILGAMTVIAGMCAYLLESWEAWNGPSRYYVMLGGSALLAAAGFCMSFLLKENKGARLFFGLGLISVLVNMTTLGGFINAAVNRSAALITQQSSAWLSRIDWFVADSTALGLMVGSALLLLTPIAWFAFKVLIRPHASRMLLLFALLGATLLVPVRESLWVGMLILFATIAPYIYLHRHARGDSHFRTHEGRFAAASLFAPALIMIARLLWLYEADVLIAWILSVIAFTGTQLIATQFREATGWQILTSLVGVVLSLMIAFLTIGLVLPWLPLVLVAPVAALVFAALSNVIAYHGMVKSPGYGLFGCAMLGLVVVLNGFVLEGLVAASIGIVIGVGMWLIGWRMNSRPYVGIGVTTAALAAVPWVAELAQLIDFTNWLTLGVIGVAAIVAGSIVERLKHRRA